MPVMEPTIFISSGILFFEPEPKANLGTLVTCCMHILKRWKCNQNENLKKIILLAKLWTGGEC
jgi:hypothetical protein